MEFKNLIDQLEPLLERLLSSEPVDIKKIPGKPLLSGVYIFFDNEKPVYVGRTKNLKSRTKSHFNLSSPNKASFVYLMAFETYGRKKASYKKEGSRKHLHADAIFKEHFISANKRLNGMTMKFIEITDPKMQHMFELYAAMKFNTPYNSFETY